MASGAVVSACTSNRIVAAVEPIVARPVPVQAAPKLAEPVLAAKGPVAPAGVRPELFRKAIAALDRHSMAIASHDRIAIADFSLKSADPRFHIINLGTGQCETLLVAHGMGSDPDHTGLLQRFSNDPGSNATCEGAFVTSDYYTGQHGASQRLLGLDTTNSNALDRAIVVHSAWYANPDMIQKWGKLGRSQGCFAVGEADLETVFLKLGQGRMIYSAKV
ncbi:MAG: murein L,D-transpeptidase catalytic domain family protein [Sphingomonas sp.]|nr:murein L,D-transpeptidase catalytic domain family protein [Sphingomonas sp.]